MDLIVFFPGSPAARSPRSILAFCLMNFRRETSGSPRARAATTALASLRVCAIVDQLIFSLWSIIYNYNFCARDYKTIAGIARVPRKICGWTELHRHLGPRFKPYSPMMVDGSFFWAQPSYDPLDKIQPGAEGLPLRARGVLFCRALTCA